MTSDRPLVGVVPDVKLYDGLPFHAVGDKYLRALYQCAGVVPLVLPAFVDGAALEGLLTRLHGLLLPGSESNVHPRYYRSEASGEHEPFDEIRDRFSLPLIGRALQLELPLLAICRGFQELNVALGGSLHAALHQLPQRLDHRAPESDDPDLRYGPRHSVELVPGGALAAIFFAERIEVNSLHRQGIAELAPGLSVEARAADGTIEGVRVEGAGGFALGVQWHPEYRALDNPFSRRLFAAFGDAARARLAG